MTIHRWAKLYQAMDYCRLGWMPLPTLNGTPHGHWAVHMIWLCSCEVKEPK